MKIPAASVTITDASGLNETTSPEHIQTSLRDGPAAQQTSQLTPSYKHLRPFFQVLTNADLEMNILCQETKLSTSYLFVKLDRLHETLSVTAPRMASSALICPINE